MPYKPTIYSDWCLADYFPDFDRQVSIHVDQFTLTDTTPFKVLLLLEPPEIRSLEQKAITNKGFYDLILTWNHKILGYCDNAVLFPFGGCWTRNPKVSLKSFAASFLISSKVMCYGHDLRQFIYDRLTPVVGSIPVKKYKSPPMLPSKESMLVPFQYAISMENAVRANYFTEKLIDCFATKTIPIYWGCPNVGDFFNTDGIITFTNEIDLMEKLSLLTPEFYESKKAAIEDNYQRSFLYSDLFERAHRVITDSWSKK
jgi:hypothetical protein